MKSPYAQINKKEAILAWLVLYGRLSTNDAEYMAVKNLHNYIYELRCAGAVIETKRGSGSRCTVYILKRINQRAGEKITYMIRHMLKVGAITNENLDWYYLPKDTPKEGKDLIKVLMIVLIIFASLFFGLYMV